MEQRQQETTGPENMLNAWVKSTSEFWQNMNNFWPQESKNAKTSSKESAHAKPRMEANWDTTLKTFKAFASTLSEQSNQEATLKGLNTLPEIVMKLAQNGLSGFMQIQQALLEKAGKVGQSVKAYDFENLDQQTFKALSDLYEKEFQQFFNIPQLGLTRGYQEKFNHALDKYNQLSVAAGELLCLLSLPVENSLKVLQEKVANLAEEGELPDSSKTYYQMWIKILEGHFLTLYQSDEYTQSLNKALVSLSDYQMAKDAVLQDLLKLLPIPSQDDMDELYKEIYLLKKRIRKLEKKK